MHGIIANLDAGRFKKGPPFRMTVSVDHERFMFKYSRSVSFESVMMYYLIILSLLLNISLDLFILPVY